MDKQIIIQVKEAAKEIYCHLLDVVDNNREDFIKYRDVVSETVEKSKDLMADLERIGIKEKQLELVLSNTDNQAKKNVFVAYMYMDWTGYWTFEHVNLYSLHRFFEERPKLSPSSISEQAGFSAKYLRMILNGERPLTDSAIKKLRPVLHLHGWGREKNNHKE